MNSDTCLTPTLCWHLTALQHGIWCDAATDVLEAAIEAFEKREDARLLCARVAFRLATRHRHSQVTARILEDVEQCMREAADLDGGADE